MRKWTNYFESFCKGSFDRETRQTGEPVLAPQIRNILEVIEAFSPRLARLAYLESTNKMNSPPKGLTMDFRATESCASAIRPAQAGDVSRGHASGGGVWGRHSGCNKRHDRGGLECQWWQSFSKFQPVVANSFSTRPVTDSFTDSGRHWASEPLETLCRLPTDYAIETFWRIGAGIGEDAFLIIKFSRGSLLSAGAALAMAAAARTPMPPASQSFKFFAGDLARR
jgi:hypothetical protein